MIASIRVSGQVEYVNNIDWLADMRSLKMLIRSHFEDTPTKGSHTLEKLTFQYNVWFDLPEDAMVFKLALDNQVLR